MSTKKQKYYVVWQGNNPGIYLSWSECQLQIKGFPGAKYKSFKTKEEAESAFVADYDDYVTAKKNVKKRIGIDSKNDIITNSLSVDAACSGSPGVMEYQGVWTDTGVRVFHVGPFAYGTNNIGEFLALVHGLSYLQKENKPNMAIYTDSRTALAWVRNKKVKTTLIKNEETKQLHQLVLRAENWLKANQFSNQIIKWKTESWGEIPADFGRK